MAEQRKPSAKRAVVPSVADVGQAEVLVQSDDAQRGSGAEDSGSEAKPAGKSWTEVSAILKAAESEFIPVTHVYVTEPEADVWNGIYGGAKVYKGDNYAVLSNGKRIPL
jgi:hypothetical protein